MDKQETNRLTIILACVAVLSFGFLALKANTDSSAVKTSPESIYVPDTRPSTPTVPSTPAQTSHGYSCTSDCSGHDAGYEWGEENEICDADYDAGNSESFNEGVRSYAEENCDESESFDEDF